MIFHHTWMEYDGITTVFQDIPVSFNYNHFTDSMMPWSGYSPMMCAGPKPSAPPADYGAVELGAKDEGRGDLGWGSTPRDGYPLVN